MILPGFIETALARHNTSLGDNKAFPRTEDMPFDERLTRRRYKEVRDKVREALGYIPTVDDAESELSRLVAHTMNVERPIRPQLEKLCEAVATHALGVPQETILLDCRLVDKVDPDVDLRILPEEDQDGYTFSDVEESAMANAALLKRRAVNAMVQGASYRLMRAFYDSSKVRQWSADLEGLYGLILALNDFLLFSKQEHISDKDPMLGAYVETHLGKGDEKTVISAQGLVYPLLLQETFRGFFELFASHGLPEDNKTAMYIIRHADFLVAEAWDLRLGVPMWDCVRKLSGEDARPSVYPYLFASIAELDTDEFNSTMGNILLGTTKGREYVQDIVDQVVHDEEYQLFSKDMEEFNLDKCLITDDGGEEDEDIIEEGLVTEGITDKTYHYCSLGSLYEILKDGKIGLTMSSNHADAYHKRKLFYLSTQRSKSTQLGYAHNSHNECRIELDGHMLKDNGYEGMPVDYWGASMGKRSDIGLDAPRVNMGGHYRKPETQEEKEALLKAQGTSSNFEFEDRIFSSRPSLPLDYVTRIDCIISPDKIHPIEKEILRLADKRGVSVSFYGTTRDFVMQTEHNINREVLESDGEYEEEPQMRSDEERNRSRSGLITNLSAMLFYYKYYNELNTKGEKTLDKELFDTLNKFNLGAFYGYVQEHMPKVIMFLEQHFSSTANEVRKLNTNWLSKSSISEDVMMYAQYVLNRYNVRSFAELAKYMFQDHPWKNKRPRQVRTREQVECVRFQYSGSSSYQILKGNTKLWDYIGKDQFIDEISRQLDEDEWNAQYGTDRVISHKSRDNQSFIKYLQHLAHNDNMTLYQGAEIINKVYQHNQGAIEMAFGLTLEPILLDKEGYIKNENRIRWSDQEPIRDELFGGEDEYYEYRWPKS